MTMSGQQNAYRPEDALWTSLKTEWNENSSIVRLCYENRSSIKLTFHLDDQVVRAFENALALLKSLWVLQIASLWSLTYIAHPWQMGTLPGLMNQMFWHCILHAFLPTQLPLQHFVLRSGSNCAGHSPTRDVIPLCWSRLPPISPNRKAYFKSWHRVRKPSICPNLKISQQQVRVAYQRSLMYAFLELLLTILYWLL